MFGRRRTTCPVDDEIREWIDRSVAALVEAFGRQKFLDAAIILPNADFFPPEFDAGDLAMQAVARRVARVMGLDGDRIDLAYFRSTTRTWDQRQVAATSRLEWHVAGRVTVHLDVAQLSLAGGPEPIAAAVAFELARLKLAERHLTDGDDSLAELATLYFGLGIFAANRISGAPNVQSDWTPSRHGNLPDAGLGYALALVEHLRNEHDFEWVRFVRGEVRAPLEQARKYLLETHSAAAGDTAAETNSRQPRSPNQQLPATNNPLLGVESSFAPPARPGFEPVSEVDAADSSRADEVAARRAAGDATASDEAESHLPKKWDELPLEVSSADECFHLGVLHAAQGEYEQAIDELSRAIALTPDDAEALYERAKVWLALGRGHDAARDASQAVELAPDDAEAYQARSQARYQLGDYRSAFDDANRALALDERDANAWYFRGLAELGLGNYERAIRDLTAAIQFDHRDVALYLVRAHTWAQLGQLKKAESDRLRAERFDRRRITEYEEYAREILPPDMRPPTGPEMPPQGGGGGPAF